MIVEFAGEVEILLDSTAAEHAIRSLMINKIDLAPYVGALQDPISTRDCGCKAGFPHKPQALTVPDVTACGLGPQ